MSFLQLNNIEKNFAGTPVLKSINLNVEDGEFVALVGPSGCGKSTLLRILAGLEAASAGDLYFAGERVNDVAPRDRDVAMVFQNYALYPHLTVRDNLGFAMAMRSLDPAEIARRCDEVARMLELEQLLDRLPKQLSGGQRQRVAMGRAIMRKPKLFLFDEPLSNLDAKLRVHMRLEISSLHRRLKATSIFVTHDQVEAMTMADRIVLLNDGMVQQVGTPRQLYHEPVNSFVATFIGSPTMNMVKLSASSLGAVKASGLVLGTLLSNNNVDLATLGLRPEAVGIGPVDGSPWPARVTGIEDLGYQSFVFSTLADGTEVCALAQRESVLRVGLDVGLYPQLD